MIEILYEWVQNIVIFMVFRTLFINILPSSKYKKYIEIFSGFILILIVISPLNQNLENILGMQIDEELFDINDEEVSRILEEAEAGQLDSAKTEYENAVTGQIQSIVEEQGMYYVEGSVVFEENTEHADYGSIYEIHMSLSDKERRKSISIEEIESIDIDRDNENHEEEARASKDSAKIKKIKSIISDFYNVKPGNIYISIQG